MTLFSPMDNEAVAVEMMDMNEQEGRSLELPVTFEQEPMSMNVQGSLCDAIDSAVKVQKVYRSYRARRRLADTAITDGLWWRAIDYAHLNQTTISFFKKSKPENAASRWNRISSNASKVGKGSSVDTRALILSFQHWIEAIDPRHRYGHSLHLYYNAWRKEDSSQPFFYWLDVGDGRKVDLIECPRSKLRQQSIKYLGPLEREKYEYIIVDGKFLHKQSREILDTVKGTEGAKWIFALSTSKRFYAGEKKKGRFHHSSFLAGGATLSAGRVSVHDGVLKTVSAYSGHYRPTDENLASFLAFLEEHEVNLSEVKIESTRESEKYGEGQSVQEESSIEVPGYCEPSKLDISYEEKGQPSTPKQVPQTESRGSDLKDLSGGHQSSVVPETVKSQTITSTNGASSFQLQHHVPLNWTTGIELDL